MPYVNVSAAYFLGASEARKVREMAWKKGICLCKSVSRLPSVKVNKSIMRIARGHIQQASQTNVLDKMMIILCRGEIFAVAATGKKVI